MFIDFKSSLIFNIECPTIDIRNPGKVNYGWYHSFIACAGNKRQGESDRDYLLREFDKWIKWRLVEKRP